MLLGNSVAAVLALQISGELQTILDSPKVFYAVYGSGCQPFVGSEINAVKECVFVVNDMLKVLSYVKPDITIINFLFDLFANFVTSMKSKSGNYI